MLFTGTASILTGSPGAVLLYPLLGFAVIPRTKRAEEAPGATRQALRYVLAGFWVFGAALQLQPTWWQSGQLSQTISGFVGIGGLNIWLVDPVLTWLSNATAGIEVPLNIALIVVFLALGIGLAVVKREQLPPFLIASIVVSVVFWYFSQASGGILTGMATDFDSGLIVVVMALACGRRHGRCRRRPANGWPATCARSKSRGRRSERKWSVVVGGRREQEVLLCLRLPRAQMILAARGWVSPRMR
jgi:hypothetical protein